MSDLEKSQTELTEILSSVAKVQNIEQYELLLNVNPLLTEGFLSDFYTGGIKNKNNGSTISVAIKKVPRVGGLFTDYRVMFRNEEMVYSKIFPVLNSFQEEKRVENRFDNIPNYFCGSLDLNKEYIAMQNIKDLGYTLLDKKICFDEDHLNLVFETFGKFHALSFALKEQQLTKYNDIVKDLKNIFDGIKETDTILESIENNVVCGLEVFNHLDDNDVIMKLINIGDMKRFILNKMDYKGLFKCILHGDCWSNNMLFKYKDSGELDDIKVLDFQLTREGSPVHDLIFFFYSGASKQDLKKLDIYLQKYYNSFSNFAKQLGSDPKKLYPWAVLKDEWKEFAVAGAYFSIDMWVPKLMDNKAIYNLRTEEASREEKLRMWDDEMDKVRKSVIFKEITRYIILHLVEYGFL